MNPTACEELLGVLKKCCMAFSGRILLKLFLSPQRLASFFILFNWTYVLLKTGSKPLVTALVTTLKNYFHCWVGFRNQTSVKKPPALISLSTYKNGRFLHISICLHLFFQYIFCRYIVIFYLPTGEPQVYQMILQYFN